MANSKYQNGKIYRLVCSDGYYYIGSTINSLNYRLNNHKQASKKQTSRVYKHIHEIGSDNVDIELIEEFPCNSKKELTEREDFYIKELKDDEFCLNFIRSHVSKEERKEINKEYYNTHKETIIEQHKEYIAENKEKSDAYQVNYRKENAEKRKNYTKQYIEEHPEWKKNYDKQYYNANKEEIKQKNKEYVKANKEKVRERKYKWAQKKKEQNTEEIKAEREAKQKAKEEKKQARKLLTETPVVCECGGSYQPYRKSRHDTSKKHLTFMKDSNSN